MIEAAAPAGTITQAFSWLPPQARSARLFGAADLRPDTTPGRGDGDRKRSRQVIDRLRLYADVQTAANAGVPEDQAGLAAALITASFQLGSSLGRAVFSGIATSLTADVSLNLVPQD
jgi:hypothetical protein